MGDGDYSWMVMGWCVSSVPPWLGGGDTDGYTHSEQGDWQLLSLSAFNLHAGLSHTDNLSDIAAVVATEEGGKAFDCDSSGGHSSVEAPRCSYKRPCWLGADDRSWVNESVSSSCVIQVISPYSTSLELVNHLLLCRGGRKSSRRKTLLSNLWVRALPAIYQLKEMSSRERSQNVRWSSGTTQEWLTPMGASCLGMSSAVAFHSPKMFTPNVF